LSISTLVIIILAVVFLALMIFVFTGGFKNLWNDLMGHTASDVESTIKHCDTACISKSQYDFCCLEREVEFAKDKEAEKITCLDERLKIECLDINCEGLCQGKKENEDVEKNAEETG